MTVKTYPSENTRRFKRLRGEFLLKYQVVGMPGEPLISNVRDLSACGVKFWTHEFLPEGTLLKLEVLIPPIDLRVKTLGRILRVTRARRTDIYYFAVAFLEIPKDEQTALNDFIEGFAHTREAQFFMDDRLLVTRRV